MCLAKRIRSVCNIRKKRILVHRVLIIIPDGKETWTPRGGQNRQEFLNLAAYDVRVYIMHTTGIRGLVDLRGPGDICSGLRGKEPGGGGNK